MSHNRNYQDMAVEIESGTGIITGTVTRWSVTSIWVTFREGGTYRFSRSQDGQFRRYGTTADPSAPALRFTDLPPAEAPVGPETEPEEAPAPVAVAKADFTKEQAKVADRIARISALARGWAQDAAEARAAVATAYLDSFRIEDLVTTAARQRILADVNKFLLKCVGSVVLTDYGQVAEFTDFAKAAELLGQLTEIAEEAYEGWHRSNSTSNVDVEIKLREHEAWQSVMRVATGKRFY